MMFAWLLLFLPAAAVAGLVLWRWAVRRQQRRQVGNLGDWLGGRGWRPVPADDTALGRVTPFLHRLGVGPQLQAAFASADEPDALLCLVRFLRHDTGAGLLLLAALPAPAGLPDCALLRLGAAHGPLRRRVEDGVRRAYLRDWSRHEVPGLPAEAPVTVYGHPLLEQTAALADLAARCAAGPDSFLVRGGDWLLVRGLSLLRDPAGEQEATVLLELLRRLRV